MNGGIPIIAENSDALTEVSVGRTNQNMVLKTEFFNSLKNAKNLRTFNLKRAEFLQFNSLSEYIKDEIPNITDLNLSGYNDRESQNILKDLKGIEKFTGLKKLTVNYTSANLDISAIKNCPTLEDVTLGYSNINSLNGIERLTNLKTLNIRNNNITALKPLENLKNLTSLNLQNNAIADTSSYIDTDGSTKTYRNLDILANLNSKRNGKLTELYLSGNNNIIDYSPVSNLTWSHKNGF